MTNNLDFYFPKYNKGIKIISNIDILDGIENNISKEVNVIYIDCYKDIDSKEIISKILE